jgi:hypothetical protein
MTKQYKQIYQIKVVLEESNPPIWRCIQVPENYSFWDLHIAIQDAMGWYDCHLHQFEIEDSQGEQITIARPDEEFGDTLRIEWETFIADYFSLKNKKAEYIYDFGDYWRHSVTLEKILPIETTQKYPRCIAGERACPPEDCGGVDGYQDLIDILNNPDHEEYQNMLDWLDREWKPEEFNAEDVDFQDPKQCLKEASVMGIR